MQARFLRVGDIVETDTGTDEVIRTVQIVVALSNGNNVSVTPDTDFVVKEPENVPGRDDLTHSLPSLAESTNIP